MSTTATSKDTSTLVQRELKKAQALVQEDAKTIGSLVVEGASSGAYLYPLKGIFYILTHRQLWESVKPLVYKSLMTSGIVVALMFIFTYLPQVALLAIISGPLAFIAAVPAVLAESLVIITFLTKALYASSATDAVFDAVLMMKGHAALVEKGRSVRKGSAGLVMGKSLLRPITGRFSTEGMVRYILSLPLNMIPALGTAVFLGYNGMHAGPACHNRYFALTGATKAEKQKQIDSNRGAYTAFGVTSLALGMIPFVGGFTSLSNAAGAALWASNLENKKTGGQAGQSAPAQEVSIGRDEL